MEKDYLLLEIICIGCGRKHYETRISFKDHNDVEHIERACPLLCISCNGTNRFNETRKDEKISNHEKMISPDDFYNRYRRNNKAVSL